MPPMNDLLFTQGQDNLSGVVGELYIAPSADILTLPALAAASSLKTAATNIAMKSTKKFQRLYITDETGKVDTNPVGERDGKGRETILTGRYPAMGVELEDAIRQYQNTPSVLIYRLARNGKLYLLGVSQLDISSTVLSLDIPAYFDQGAGSSGDARSAQNGALLGWKFTAAHGPIEYAGTVPLTPAL
jgi:hypothetical protein